MVPKNKHLPSLQKKHSRLNLAQSRQLFCFKLLELKKILLKLTLWIFEYLYKFADEKKYNINKYLFFRAKPGNLHIFWYNQMQNLTIKATYKQKNYIFKGNFPTEDSIKNQIVNRKIGNFTTPDKFSIQYPNKLKNYQQALKLCSNLTLKITILKNKKTKSNLKNNLSEQQSETYSVSIRQKSSSDVSRNAQCNALDQQNASQYKSNTFLNNNHSNKQQNGISVGNQINLSQKQTDQIFKPFKIKQIQKDQVKKNKIEENQLPVFDISQIYEKGPLDSKNESKNKNKIISNKSAQKQGQKVIKNQIYCRQCFNPQKENNQLCSICMQNNLQEMFRFFSQNFRKQVQKSVQKCIQDKIAIIKISNYELKKELLQYKEKTNKNEKILEEILDKIKKLITQSQIHKNQNQNFKEGLKLLESQLQIYQKTFFKFQKDFKTINQVNFQLQQNYIIIQQKIHQMVQKLKIYQSQSNHQNIKIYNPSIDTNPIKMHSGQKIKPELLKAQSIPQPQPQKKNWYQPQAKKPTTQIKQQMQKEKQAWAQIPKKDLKEDLKPIDCSLQQIQKVNYLQVGQVYQSQIYVKNTGLNRWPSKVYIFQKDSKRTNVIQSLEPNQKIIFSDNFSFKAERQGQNIQIRYQLYYLDDKQKQYIGLPLSIFIKVKKRVAETNDLQKDGQQMQEKQNFQKKALSQDHSNIDLVKKKIGSDNQKSNELIKKINSIKRKFKVAKNTTKQINQMLKSLGINQENFQDCEDQVLEEIISGYCSQN